MNSKNLIGSLVLLFSLISCQQSSDKVWIQDCDPNDEASCGFKNAQGDLEIEYGKYPMIFTDTFRNYAIVVDEQAGIIGIDKSENVLYQVFAYDNGPDYVSDGYFRIVENDKIGFADAQTGEVKIKPQYTAADPFLNGYAPICPNCKIKKVGEYTSWVDGNWGLIDKQGNVVVAPKYKRIESVLENGKAFVVEDSTVIMIEIAK
jgi:hypothetical protein